MSRFHVLIHSLLLVTMPFTFIFSQYNETAAEMGNSAKITEIIETGQRTVQLAEELGLIEIGQLKQAGQLRAPM